MCKARALQPSGLWPERGMDSDMGAAVCVSGMWSHDEPTAGLAASVAVVRGSSDHRSAVPVFDTGGELARDRSPLWPER